ncbi:hypothetical protein ASG90_05925 [Nocardioides sp. Soil797]|nr:hypothetical protein ASG90_05925 [Nocardioides sp. Soil797]
MRSLSLVVVSALLLFVGCNGDSSASDELIERSPTVPPSSSESASIYTPPEPAKPPKGGWPEDKPASEISAEKVARIWVQELSSASEAGDTRRLRHISTPECTECVGYAEDIDEDFADGVVVKFRCDAYRPGELIHANGESARHVEIALRVKACGGTRHEASDPKPLLFHAQQFKWYFVLALKKRRWRIVEMALLE